MKRSLTRIVSVFAAIGIAMSANALIIIPTFDGSITSDPNGAAMMTAINAAINVLQTNLTDNATVKITFVSDESVGLGQSSTFGFNVAYSDYIAALISHAASANDVIALSKLPAGPNNPVTGGTQIHLTTAQARLLGLSSFSATDSTISLKMSAMNFTRPPSDPDKYDLQQVTEHEVDEVLGISSALPATDTIGPVDLFRYTTNRFRTYTTNGDDAYFSIDGTNLLARYNMDAGGDYGDWWSVNGNWSPVTGISPSFPQVQDAFSGPNLAIDLGKAELTALDVVGWTLAVAAPQTPPIVGIIRSGVNQFTLSWTNTATGFVLQERTNLISGSWAFATTGSTNPAVIVSTNSLKFYRLYKPGSGSTRPAQNAVVVSVPQGPLTITTRSIQPRKP